MARGGCWRGMGSEFSLVEGARIRAGDEEAGSHAKAGSCTSFLSSPAGPLGTVEDEVDWKERGFTMQGAGGIINPSPDVGTFEEAQNTSKRNGPCEERWHE